MAWLSLAPLGSAWLIWVQAPKLPAGRSLAQLGSAWLSLAPRTPAGRRKLTCPLRSFPPGSAQHGSAWLSLAQLGSAWLSRAQTPKLPAWLSLVQLGSAWLRRAPRAPTGRWRLSDFIRSIFPRSGGLAQLGSAWLSLAQLGSARASITLARPGPATPSVSSMGQRILRRAWGAHKADETLTPPNQRARNMQSATVDPRENRKLVRRNYFGGGRAREEFRKPAGKLFCWFCNRKNSSGEI